MYARALLLAALACVQARAHAVAQYATSDLAAAKWNEDILQPVNLSKPLPELKIYLDKYERNDSNLKLTETFNQIDNETIFNKTMSLRQNQSDDSERRLYNDILNNGSFRPVNFVRVLNVETDLHVNKSYENDNYSVIDGSVLRRRKEKRSANRVLTVNKDADFVSGSTVLRVEVTSVIPIVHVAERSRKIENTKNSSSGAPLLNYIFDTYSNLNAHQHRGDRSGGPSTVKAAAAPDVTSHVEATAHLDCKVAALQDKVVSWVRRKEIGDSMELLTIGTQKYAADARYSVEFVAPDTWRLQIAHVRATDAGDYECQVSAHPPVHTRSRLLVPPPELQILDENGREFQEKFCELNSTISLQCVVRNIAMTGRVVDWYHGDKHLNYDVERGGISVRTRLLEAGAESVLRVARVTPHDGGRYACGVSELRAVVTVHVLKGESLAELHQGSGTSIAKTMTLTHIIQVLLYILIISVVK